MAHSIDGKENLYLDDRRKKKEIAMPPLDQMPPVLAENPSDWGGNNQQVTAPEVQEAPEEIENVETDTDEVDAIEEHEQEEHEVQQKPKPSSKEASENLRILREAREKAERERDELMQYVLQMQKQQQPQQKEVVQEIPEPEVDFSVDDEALLEGKHGKQLYKELQQMKKRLAQYESKSSEAMIEAKIKAQFPDFDAVVNNQTIQALNEQEPEIAATLRSSNDLYSKAVSAYKAMKKFGIYKDKTYDQDKQIALKNSVKPRTVTSLNPQQGDSPLSKANAFASGMTKDLQAQLLKEMADARKNL